MTAVFGVANASGLFAINDVKVRLRPYQYYQLGEGKIKFVYIHCYTRRDELLSKKHCCKSKS